MRISGPGSANILNALGVDPLPPARMASLKKLIHQDTKEVIDHALVLWFPAPASYTGEDVVELHIHGGRAIINELTQYLQSLDGVRLAEPGEFSRRAFINGKMDLTMLEGVADMIDAQTAAQKKQALRQMDGGLETLYEDWRLELIEILAHMEAYIDFPDEDIPDQTEEKIINQVGNLIKDLQAHLSDRRGQRLREGLYAVIIGAPNVGKSSLMNALARKDVAIVSNIAGTTRDVIEVQMDIGGYPLTLADTAGLRNTSDDIESKGIALARKRAEQADIRICLFDAENPQALDEATMAMIDDNSVIVMNKADRCPQKEMMRVKGAVPVMMSAKTGQGIDNLIDRLEDMLGEIASPAESPLFTRQRHKAGLEQAVNCLEDFLISRRERRAIELAAEDLRLAARSLGSVTGRIEVEDLLDKIFSSFCIGK